MSPLSLLVIVATFPHDWNVNTSEGLVNAGGIVQLLITRGAKLQVAAGTQQEPTVIVCVFVLTVGGVLLSVTCNETE